jgi:Na+/melibiose symporter-like transporter
MSQVQTQAQGGAHTINGNGSHDAPLLQILLRPSSTQQVNQRNVLIDAIGVGITAGVGSFLSVFLVRLGATNFQVGLLTAMPALTGMLLAIPIGEFLARRRQIVPWFARSRFWVLSSYVLTGLVPFIFTSHQPEVIILIWALATLPQTVVSVAFTVVMGGVAGPGGRFTLMSRRWSILGLTNSLTVMIVGQLLKLFDFPLNYQVVFIGSAIGAFISVMFSSSIKLPPQDVPVEQTGLLETFRTHGSALRRNKPFVNFTVSQFVFRWGLALALPLFPIYWVKNVGATDQQISAINATQTFVLMIAYFVWSKLAVRKGERWVLLVAAFGISFYPALTGLTHNPVILIPWAAMAGFFSAGIDLVFFDIVLSTCPDDHRASYVGMYQTTIYIATFLAPLLGTALSSWTGIVPVLMLATVLRLAGAVMFARLHVGKGL